MHLKQTWRLVLVAHAQWCYERNERGFALFLQNLKSVLNLLASADELETDVLIQIRSRLVDASGTLSFLLNDMSNRSV